MGMTEGIEALMRRFGMKVENHEITHMPLWMRIVAPLISILIVVRGWQSRGVPGLLAALVVAATMMVGAVAVQHATRWEHRHRVLALIFSAALLCSCGFLLATFAAHLTDAECALVGAAVACVGVGLRVGRELSLR